MRPAPRHPLFWGGWASWIVAFDDADRAWLAAYARRRVKDQLEQPYSGLTKYEAELIGMAGEAAFALATGLWWDSACLDGRDPGYDFRLPDGRTVDVKARSSSRADLTVSPRYPVSADVIVLATPLNGRWERGQPADAAHIRGWISRRGFYKQARLTERDGRKEWRLAASKLLPMHLLARRSDE